MSQPATISIEQIPNKLLEKIFSHLGLYDSLSASTVCKRWSNMSLSSEKLGSVEICIDFQNNGEEHVYHRTLLASNRSYRHFLIVFGKDPEQNDLLLAIMGKFSGSTETLRLMSDFVPVGLGLFSKILKQCPNLQQLHLPEDCTIEYEKNIRWQPLPSLQKLYMYSRTLIHFFPRPDFRKIAPNLTTLHFKLRVQEYFDGVKKTAFALLQFFGPRLTDLNIDVPFEEDLAFIYTVNLPQLVKLHVRLLTEDEFSQGGSVGLKKIFQDCPGLRDVSLDCNVYGSILGCLAQSCTHLQYLRLQTRVKLSAEKFVVLAKLEHLKCIEIEDSEITVSASDVCPPFKGLLQLTLYYARVRDPVGLNCFIRRSFPMLAVLEMEQICGRTNMNTFYASICSNVNTIERLVVHECGQKIELDLFNQLGPFPRLRDLRLCMNLVTYDTPLNGTNLDQIRTMSLSVAELNDDGLLKLVQLCPGIRKLTISKFHKCTPMGIQVAREQSPLCDISIIRRLELKQRI